MAKINASLKTLAREIKNAAGVKAQKKVAVKKTFAMPKGWCGKHSELPTDIDWTKVPRNGAFDARKRDRGNNRPLAAAICQAAYNKKMGI